MYKMSKDDKKYMKKIINFKQERVDNFPYQIDFYEKDRAGHMAKGLRAALAVLFLFKQKKGILDNKQILFQALNKLHFMDYSKDPGKAVEWNFIAGVMNSIVHKMAQANNELQLAGLIAHECMTLGVIEMSIHVGVNNLNWNVLDSEVNTLGELIVRNIELLNSIVDKVDFPKATKQVFPYIKELKDGTKPTFLIGNTFIILNSGAKPPVLGVASLNESLELLRFSREKEVIIDKVVYLNTRFGVIQSFDFLTMLGAEGMNSLMKMGTEHVQKILGEKDE